MSLVSSKGLLAIAAVIDIALHSAERPVSGKALAARHALPSRHLEPVLQALVRNGILNGIRGPHGGYRMARDPRDVTAEDILAAAESGENRATASTLVQTIVGPALRNAELSFSVSLSQVTIASMIERIRQQPDQTR